MSSAEEIELNQWVLRAILGVCVGVLVLFGAALLCSLKRHRRRSREIVLSKIMTGDMNLREQLMEFDPMEFEGIEAS